MQLFLLTTAAPKSTGVPKIFMITEPVWDTVCREQQNQPVLASISSHFLVW